ncbi:RlpA-like double-psi beta-barrel-protein domain-containing protein-containing protein [Mycena latifolia]|nr:RlpA-like double-psi beta-barrel-protein domain-containing protein-containing protein [Mycena latifolia]
MKSIASLAAFIAVAAAATFAGVPGRIFVPEGGRGACGAGINNTNLAASLQPNIFDNGAHCGESITVTALNGNTVTVTVQDSCTGCRDNTIELTPSAFEVLAPLDSQETTVTYTV